MKMTPAEYLAGLERHGKVMGFPRRVDGDGWYAVPNLVRVVAGDPDPWRYVYQGPGDVVDLQDAGDRGVYVGGMEVSADDFAPVLRAVAIAQAGDGRLAAGRAALAINDTMVRARTLDAVGGWGALREGGTMLDEDPEHGALLRPAESLGLACLILCVTCPSTGAQYALRVGEEHQTARAARLWTLGLRESPEVET